MSADDSWNGQFSPAADVTPAPEPGGITLAGVRELAGVAAIQAEIDQLAADTHSEPMGAALMLESTIAKVIADDAAAGRQQYPPRLDRYRALQAWLAAERERIAATAFPAIAAILGA